ncbi:stromal processing peptidase, chloroplastic [Morus notabilis]|uniref:stromal processing peptidase, chloroplastic n=1 Tax=Morus notabilis TaxID=981085 RepID=UPI000CED211D|nr:stromal processing peptidase, chloroplastic [Morus notabilis]
MACTTNKGLKRGLRLIDCFNYHESLKWIFLVPNLQHRLSFYSSTSRIFISSNILYKGRNKITSIPRVLPQDTRSNFRILCKPSLYSTAFVKPCAYIDLMVKSKSSIMKMQDNLEGFLTSELPFHPKLIRGQLKNGLRYCILQHKRHPNRFEAHLEVHVGPVHEEDDEQGLAHMTEHVLLDCDSFFQLPGPDSGKAAYTSFNQTVYHITSQTILEHFNEDLPDEDLVPYVLNYLNEIAFKPKIRASYLEKQRDIVLSELQMGDAIDHRIELQAAFGKSNKRSSAMLKNRRPDHPIRPLLTIYHNWSLPKCNIDDQRPPVQIFQHNLIHNFSFHICSKIPLNKLKTYGDLRNFVMKQIYLSILDFRINAKYESSNSSSRIMELNHWDFGQFGCACTSLAMASEPRDWETTIKMAFHEVRRLKELGINYEELTIHKDAIVKDNTILRRVLDNTSSHDAVKFIMYNDTLGHTTMEQREADESLAAVATTITLEEVNSIGAQLLEFVSDFGKPSAPVPTTIMACAPSTCEVNGELIKFTINRSEIEFAMKQGLEEVVHAEPEIEIPTELISSSELQELWLERQPTFIPPISSKPNVMKLHDKGTDTTQLRLSNGISVNYKISKNEGEEGVIRVIIDGGRARESSDLKGAIVVGVQTLFEGGCVGNFTKEQVKLFCLKNMIDYSLESTEEFISVELSFTTRENGMQAAFQLLHMLLEQSVWLEDAFDRARQLHFSKFQSNLKSLEQSTTRKMMLDMLGGDERFVKPTQISLQNLTLQSVKDAVLNQFRGNNMEVSIVGDFCEEDIDSFIIHYLGTVKATRNFKIEVPQYNPIKYGASTSHMQSQSQVYLKDTKERSYACVAGLTPNMWGFTIDGKHYLKSKFIEGPSLHNKLRGHPLFFGITMEYLTYILDSIIGANINASSLSYEATFNTRLFDKLNLGWYMISITSTPSKVHESVDVCKKVLKGFRHHMFSEGYCMVEDFSMVRRVMLSRHEDEIKSNAYWLNLLCHMQPSSLPRKDISCFKDLASLYEVVNMEDIFFCIRSVKS